MVHLTESEAALALHWGSVYCNLKGKEISANTVQLQAKLQKSVEEKSIHVVNGKVRHVKVDKDMTTTRYYLYSEGRLLWMVVHYVWAAEPDTWCIYKGKSHNEKQVTKAEALAKIRSFDPKLNAES